MSRWVRWLAMARAPGGELAADAPSAHRDTARLVAFSDAVFAITITLLVLEIRPPTPPVAIGRRFQLALAWLTTGALLGAALPVLGVAVIAAFNAFFWIPIRGENPRGDPERT